MRHASGKRPSGQQRFIDHSGDMVIPPRYYRENSFHNGWALVEFEGRTQVIDRKGTVIWEHGFLLPISDEEPHSYRFRIKSADHRFFSSESSNRVTFAESWRGESIDDIELLPALPPAL